MPAVLIEGSVLQCSHGGVITLTAGQTVLRSGEARVFVVKDLDTALFACPLQAPCIKIDKVDAGVSTRLTAGGKAVLLTTARGTTNAGTWQVFSARETKLEAI